MFTHPPLNCLFVDAKFQDLREMPSTAKKLAFVFDKPSCFSVLESFINQRGTVVH